MRLALAALLGFFALSTTTYARIVIEPQVGYTWGDFDPNESGASTSNLKGLNLGAKLYYEMPAWFLGVDYNYNKLDIKGTNDDFTNNEIGAIVGLNFAQFFKLYGGYIFNNNGEAGDYKPDGKGGYKIGLSFLALKNVAIGLEYKKVEFKKEGAQSKDPFYTGTSVLISFPFGT